MFAMGIPQTNGISFIWPDLAAATWQAPRGIAAAAPARAMSVSRENFKKDLFPNIRTQMY